jgi:uncharacterized membrane protein
MNDHKANENLKATWVVTLVPHRSLSKRGFVVVMGLIAGISFLCGGFFWWVGAWPIFGFMGLDVLLIWWAFKVNFRDGTRAERLSLTGDDLCWQQAFGPTQIAERHFNRRWVRVILEKDTERELIGKLYLASHGKRTEIAGFLGGEERQSLALALNRALAD